jgi:hypothetical protein
MSDAYKASDEIFRIADKNNLVVIVWSTDDVHKSIEVLGYKPITEESATNILLECSELLQEICGEHGRDVIERQIEYLGRYGLTK